jgi:DNA uptake protein ComE-like DNA-binding protein
MKRAIIPAVLLVTLIGCQQDAPPETPPAADVPVATAPAQPAVTAEAPAPAPTLAEGAMVDPNQATREQLLAVPNMNEAAADALVAGRPFADMRAVDRVLASHVSDPQQREEWYRRVWRPLDLNTATSEEILLIPGVGKRMQHEFEEYRPYRSIEQFRREIGKYVNQQEVARLEQYVSIR